MKRREFLKQAGCFVATASMGGLAGCGDDSDMEPSGDGGLPGDGGSSGGSVLFPQGVASGDPRPSSVMLWTRALPDDGDGPVSLMLQVARDDAFDDLVVEESVEASAASDHTVRVLVDGLDADTIYYYRFRADGGDSRVGRTWTAPDGDADTEVRFAWASCQDYSTGFHSAYRRMINDDEDAPDDERLRFILHVGDFIYETRNDEAFQIALDDDLEPIELRDASGEPRAIPPFPDGGSSGDSGYGGSFALTLADYRHLYRTYLSDPDLQAARARWPFVCIWDDHEFSNDCWQTQANYTGDDSTNEPSQRRKVAANQAWFEYIPAILSEAEEADGVAPAAHDFMPAEVEDAPYADMIEVDEPNNVAALATLTVYRRLRFGQHVELVLTDNRSYRSDHALPEEVTAGDLLTFDPRAGLPLDAVVAFDAGETFDGGNPPDEVAGFENVRRDSPPGTILGPEQKQWFKQVMGATDATFKVWGNSLPLLRIRLDASAVDLIPADLMMAPDGWDGYGTERAELMAHFRDEGIRNVLSFSGDHHAHFAGLVYDDFDGDAPTPVMVDFAAGGISSTPQFVAVAGAIQNAAGEALAAVVEPVLKMVSFDGTLFGGDRKVVPNMNTLILYGGQAANVAAETGDAAMAEAMRDPGINDHLRYADASARGYGLAAVGGDGARVTLVTIESPLEDRGEDGAEVRSRAHFEVPLLAEGDTLDMAEPDLEGEPPFPLGPA